MWHKGISPQFSKICYKNIRVYTQTDPLSVPNRRETSHRKAKGNSFTNMMVGGRRGLDDLDDDPEEPSEFLDSDSDPAWSPQPNDKVEQYIYIDVYI